VLSRQAGARCCPGEKALHDPETLRQREGVVLATMSCRHHSKMEHQAPVIDDDVVDRVVSSYDRTQMNTNERITTSTHNVLQCCPSHINNIYHHIATTSLRTAYFTLRWKQKKTNRTRKIKYRLATYDDINGFRSDVQIRTLALKLHVVSKFKITQSQKRVFCS